jgi:hypothetical protein
MSTKSLEQKWPGWKTNFNKRSVDLNEIKRGGPPKDGIPAIDVPKFVAPEKAASWLALNEPVIAHQVKGEAKAYPLQILIWHEIVNDLIDGVPVTATFCPLCHTAIVFDRWLDGRTHDFGVSGMLRYSDMIMYNRQKDGRFLDRETRSTWNVLGQCVSGHLKGKQPEPIGHGDFFAFAWVVFQPETEIHQPPPITS